MAQILDGKEVSAAIKAQLKREVDNMVAQGFRPPHLVAILVGEDGASQTYVGAKHKACDEIGFTSEVMRFDASMTEDELLQKIEDINQNSSIDGLIVQLPLPKHINEAKVTEAIAPHKDVDGFTDINMGRLAKGMDGVKPATPLGITLLMKHYNIETAGKNIVVLGRSNIVGRPISIMLSGADETGNGTVTVCHSKTKNLTEITKAADIIVAAIGKPGFLTGEMVNEKCVVIDVGTTRVDDATKKAGWRLSGDVDYQSVSEKVAAITPVPGGIGPMTIAGLMYNTLQARKLQLKAQTA